MEQGREEEASIEKERLENKQRRARKLREESQIVYKPNYFQETIDQETQEVYYKYIRDYWKDREESNWEHLADLFSHAD